MTLPITSDASDRGGRLSDSGITSGVHPIRTNKYEWAWEHSPVLESRNVLNFYSPSYLVRISVRLAAGSNNLALRSLKALVSLWEPSRFSSVSFFMPKPPFISGEINQIKCQCFQNDNILNIPKTTPAILLSNFNWTKLMNFSMIFDITAPTIMVAKNKIIKHKVERYLYRRNVLNKIKTNVVRRVNLNKSYHIYQKHILHI